jgi:hypothetical protein
MGEKSGSFSRKSEQERPLIKISEKHALKMFPQNIFKVPIDKN